MRFGVRLLLHFDSRALAAKANDVVGFVGLLAPGDGVAPAGSDITLVKCSVAAAAAGREPNRP